MSKLTALCGTIVILVIAYDLFDRDSENNYEGYLSYESEEIEHQLKPPNKTVIKLVDGVYVALNFGLANVIMLEGKGEFEKCFEVFLSMLYN